MTAGAETVRLFWEDRVQLSGQQRFLVHSTRSWTYDEFDRWVNELANGLRGHGVREGTHVAMLLPNSPDLLRAVLAVQKLGAVMVPMIAGLTHAEATFVLGHSDAEYLLTDAPAWEVLTATGGIATGQDLRVFVMGTGVLTGRARPFSDLESGDHGAPSPPSSGPLDPMALMYTSGSTGRPKGVIVPNAGMAAAGHGIAARLEMTPADTVLAAMPFFHIAALDMLLAPAIAAGAAMAMMDRFDRREFWPLVRASSAVVTLLIPAQLSLLMTEPAAPTDRDHTLTTVMSHIRPEAFRDRFGVDICTTWAMTETSAMGTLTSRSYPDHRPKLIGWPFPDSAEVKVIDAEGHQQPPDAVGELCFRHPHVMPGYYKDAENTAQNLRDGWVHTGDLCAIDDQGRVYFHGRLKNIIKRAGENIAGEEVEFTIMAHPKVEECIVFGVDDPVMTEEVFATIVVREGETLTADQVVSWCSQELSSWKAPRFIQLRTEAFPRLANGKTDRKAVIEAVDVNGAWDRREAGARV